MRPYEPEVTILDEFDRPAATQRKRALPLRWGSPAVGLVATILLHLLACAPLLLGFAAHRAPPRPDAAPGSLAWNSDGNRRESMMLLDLSALAADELEQDAPDLKTEGIELDKLALALTNTEIAPPPDIQIEDAQDAESANDPVGDPAGAAALFGRYMGQIASRIERAWMRPRSAVEGGHFDCRARIEQDRQGRVLSIEYQDCGADPTWRESLRSAILRSSPLSAPPEHWLFAETITLNFFGDQYVANKTPDYLYEPQARKIAQRSANFDQPALPAPPGDLELIIEGSDVRWKKAPSASSDK
jgi:hypothetical protein